MARLKTKDWAGAESDASSALEIDDTHVKSYQRRSAARVPLGKLRAALKDLHIAEAVAGEASESVTNSIAREKKKVEAALRAAVRRAPKRKVPIAVVKSRQSEKGTRPRPESNSGGSDAGTDQTKLSEPSYTPVDDRCSAISQACLVAKSSDEGTARGNVEPEEGCDTNKNARKKARRPRTIPKTWYEFEGVWKNLPRRSSDRSSLLRRIKPRKLAALYKSNGIEDPDLLASLVAAAAEIDDGADYVRAIAGIRSIDIPVMMMTEEHRDTVRDAIRTCFGKDDAAGDSSEVASKLGC